MDDTSKPEPRSWAEHSDGSSVLPCYVATCLASVIGWKGLAIQLSASSEESSTRVNSSTILRQV